MVIIKTPNRYFFKDLVKKFLIFCLVSFFATQNVLADLKVPAYLSDGVVLQQQSKVILWGWDIPGNKIKINCNWSDSLINTKADNEGKWQAAIKTNVAGGPYQISIQSNKESLSIKNILFGEVWLCSGQSNMVFRFSNSSDYLKDKEEMNLPQIRYLEVERSIEDEPQNDIPGSVWKSINPDNADRLSAVALYFAQKLQMDINIPIGIIEASWGGTAIDSWTPLHTLKENARLAVNLDRWEDWKRDFKKDSIAYQAQLHALKNGEIAENPEMPITVYINKRPQRKPSSLFNGMIAPLSKFRIKGVIWYQGETNRTWSEEYEYHLIKFIESWRNEWGYNLPFCLVQLAPYKGKAEAVSQIMEAQFNVSNTMEDVGLVVTMDVGDMDDIHPKNKKPVGQRLANWALSKIYGYDTKFYSGPIFKGYERNNNSIKLFFEHTLSGLIFQEELNGFEYIEFNENGTQKPPKKLELNIDDKILSISTRSISFPIIVRYGWGLEMARANLFNAEGLPACPFRVLVK